MDNYDRIKDEIFDCYDRPTLEEIWDKEIDQTIDLEQESEVIELWQYEDSIEETPTL